MHDRNWLGGKLAILDSISGWVLLLIEAAKQYQRGFGYLSCTGVTTSTVYGLVLLKFLFKSRGGVANLGILGI